MATTRPEDNPTALKKACVPTNTQVACSIILSPSAGSPELAAYLDRLTRQNIRCDYEVIVGGRAADIEPSRPEAPLPRVRVVEVHADLEQEPAFDACAATAQGKYLLFVRELVDFDVAMLEESIKELENSGNKLSVSGTAKFVLVERSFYREAGLLDRLLEPVDFLDKGCGIPGETSSSKTRSDLQPNERGDVIRDEYSNLLDLGQFFRDVDDYVILKLPESFPNYRDHSDIDILCKDRDRILKHILNVGKAYQDKGFRIEAAECARNLHVDFFAPGACRLNFRFDLLDGLTYEKFEIGSGYTDVVLKSRQRISRSGVTIYVPALEHDLAIRFLEYVEHQDKRPDKIKHWEYIKSHYHPGFVDIINSHTDLKLTVERTENGVNLAVSRKNPDQRVIEAAARPAQHKFYHLSETCQIPELGEIYERYFGRRTDGCFVEVGAFDGEFVSNTSGLADIGWTGHYIEPVPEYAQRCRVRHAKNAKVTVSQIAIGPEPATVKINVAATLSTISERAKRNFQSLDWAEGHFRQERKVAVRQLTLDDYLEQHTIQPGFELLVVDVEGYEWEVFRNFDIEKWRPHMVVVELPDQNNDFVELREDYKKLVQYFVDHDYKAVYKDAINTIYVRHTRLVTKTGMDHTIMGAGARGLHARASVAGAVGTKTDILEVLREKGLWQDGLPIRLHLGCGGRPLAGYINVDYPPSEHNLIDVKADIYADITRLSFPANSVDEIRLHHVFEHFNRVTALVLLIKWHQWLKVGGQLFLETPDLMGCARMLLADVPWKTKMGAIRHLAGDQAAAWGFHLDHWFAERFRHTLEVLGFQVVQTKQTRWSKEPYLCSIQVLAKKVKDVPVEKQAAASEELLWESTVSPKERLTWETWRKQLRTALNGHFVLQPSQTSLPEISSVSRASQILSQRWNSLPLQEIHGFNQRTRDRWVEAKAKTVPAGSRVLDVGAGTCPYRAFFSHCDYKTQDFKKYTGLKKNGATEYGQIDYVSDIAAIPVADASFDVVLCTEVLEHVPEPVRALEEMARVLQSGGRLFVTAPLGSGLHQLPYHYYGGMSKQWYVHFLPKFGLHVREITPNGGFFKFLAQECARVVWTMRQHEHLHGENVEFIRHLFGEWLPRYLFALEEGCFIDQFTVGYHVEAVKRSEADVTSPACVFGQHQAQEHVNP